MLNYCLPPSQFIVKHLIEAIDLNLKGQMDPSKQQCYVRPLNTSCSLHQMLEGSGGDNAEGLLRETAVLAFAIRTQGEEVRAISQHRKLGRSFYQ